MKTISLSATDLKRNTADVLNSVIYGGEIAIIERYGEPVAKIVPFSPSSKKLSKEEVINKYFGAIPDFPDVTKFRKSRKKWPTL